jgi:hypothetical protein
MRRASSGNTARSSACWCGSSSAVSAASMSRSSPIEAPPSQADTAPRSGPALAQDLLKDRFRLVQRAAPVQLNTFTKPGFQRGLWWNDSTWWMLSAALWPLDLAGF